MDLGFLRPWQEGELREPNWGPLSGHRSAHGRPFHTPASAQRQGPMSAPTAFPYYPLEKSSSNYQLKQFTGSCVSGLAWLNQINQ